MARNKVHREIVSWARASIVFLAALAALAFGAAPLALGEEGGGASARRSAAPAPKAMPPCDATEDAAGAGQVFESVRVSGLTDFREGTNGVAFADFDGNGYLDVLTVTTPPFVLAEELKGRQQPRDTLRLLLNDGGFVLRPCKITLKGSPATPEDFGQGWRGSQIPVVADFNDDGLLDFFVSRQFPGVHDKVREGRTPVGNSLFLADGAFHTFRDVSRELGVRNERAYNRQASLGDVNRDGYIDIAVGADNTTSAFEGIPKAALLVYEPGDGAFTSGRYHDIGGTDLVPDFGGFHRDPARDKAGPKVTLRDIDNDGDLDLFQSAHVLINIGYDARRLPLSPATYRQGVFTWRNLLVETGAFRFEKSVGNGLAAEARLRYDDEQGIYVPAGEAAAPGLAYLFFADVNNDALFDAVAVDGTDALFTPKTEDVAGRFWTNQGGFRFTEATRKAGLSSLNHTYREWYRFFDGEITPRLDRPLPLGRMNKSQPGLPDRAPLDLRPYHGDVVFADFDNDTHLDFVVLDRREAKLLEVRAILYRNRGDGTFAPMPTTFSGLDSTGIAGEAVDFDNDGLVDLFVSGDPDNTAPEGNPGHRYEDKVYHNTGAVGGSNHWLRLRFSGVSHAALLGTRVEIFRPGTGVRLGTRGIYAEHAYKSASPLEAHFGLGENETADVRVFPPGGKAFTLRAVEADRYLDLNVAERVLTPVPFEAGAASAPGEGRITLDEEHRIEAGGANRVFRVIRPARYRKGAPAVVLLHGGSQSMRKVLGEKATTRRWRELAERDGFLLLVPNGYSEREDDAFGDRQTWNDLRPDPEGRLSQQDDVEFVKAVLDWAAARHGIDPSRVYATGSSNGGMMALRLLVECPERFAAGAAFIAALPEDEVPTPPRGTPVMLMNGTDDPLVRWQGGVVSRNGAPTRSVDDTVDYWLAVNGVADAEPVSRELADDAPDDACRVTSRSWAVEPGAPPAVVRYTVHGGGHCIPDPTPPEFSPLVQRMIGPACRDVHGVDLAWAFLRRHDRDELPLGEMERPDPSRTRRGGEAEEADPRVRKILDRFDADGDGKLSPEEAPRRIQNFFDRVDASGDGYLDAEELGALLEGLGGRR